MDDERYQVSIPANVKIRTELINGIGIKELITTAIAGTICVFIDLILYAITKNYLICIILFGVVTGFTFIAVMKDKNNSCIADMIKNMYQFFKGQKYFEFDIEEKK